MIATVYSTLSGKLVGKHPTLGVLVSEDGMVLTRKHGGNSLEWKRGTLAKASKSAKPYLRVRIGGGHKKYVHVLVAETFLPNPENKPYVDHRNRNRTDNRVQNLQWVTAIENANNTETVLNARDLGVRWRDDKKEANRRYMRQKRQNPDFRKEEYERHKQWKAKKKAEQSAQPSV